MEAYAEHGFGRDDRQTAQPKSRILGGLLTMTGSGVSNQIGAGIGAHAFPALGPAGVVAVRQLVAAAVLLPAARPPLHRLTWKQWWPALLLGGTIALMNICLYVAIQRIGLGLAVTLEFLGPLAIALMRSRSKLDVLCAVSAGVGVYVLVLPGPSSDFLGIGIAAVGAACWGAYILLNRVVGQRLPGLQGPAVATLVSMVFYLPVAGPPLGGVIGRTGTVVFGHRRSALLCHPLCRGPRCTPSRSAGVLRRVHEHQPPPRSPLGAGGAGPDPRPA